MCTHDLFIEGLFTLQKNLQGVVFFKIKVNDCILTHSINVCKFFGEIILKLFILLILPKKSGKKIAIQTTR
jgi:hypothetical protein